MCLEQTADRTTYVSGYKCEICGSRHKRKKDVSQHIDGKKDGDHEISVPSNHIEPVEHEVSSTTYEALYTINKYAKKNAERASRAYRRGRKSKAKEESNKKKALYRTKEELLENIQHLCHKVEEHEIKEDKFYCLYFIDENGVSWSFHTPKRGFNIEQNIENSETLDDFEKGTSVVRSDFSLKRSLVHIDNKHNIDANRFIPRTPIGTRITFTGWEYLD